MNKLNLLYKWAILNNHEFRRFINHCFGTEPCDKNYRLLLGADETPAASLGGDGDRWAKFQDFNMKLERFERVPTQCFMLTIVEMIVCLITIDKITTSLHNDCWRSQCFVCETHCRWF
jgi:hypothetical protein